MTSLAILPLLVALADPPAVAADFVIRGVTIFDGTRQPGRKGDIAIKGDRITAVGSFAVGGKPREIDGTGLYAAPGFIDLHTHCDGGSTSVTTEAGRQNLCYLTQGVTTVVTGNCGSGPVDVAAFFTALGKNGVGTNVIHLAPHNAVRSKAMGNANRAPNAAELADMEGLVDRAMKDGAWGLSTGLIYNPGTFAKTDEIVALAKVAAKHGGFYASHIRSEGGGLLDAIEEALAVGRSAGLPVHISHIKASGRASWGKSADAIALVAAARAKGQVVTADQYPYTASSTSLAATLVPARFREGTPADYQARLSDPDQGAAIRKAVTAALGPDDGERIRVAQYKPNTAWNGMSIAKIAAKEKKTPTEVVIEIERKGGASVVNFGMDEEDVRLYMKQPWVATASDGSSQSPGDSVPHPRSYGTFPRKLGRYAIADGVVSPEFAVRSASGLPADILRLKDRGYLKPGQFADVVVFDPKTYRDVATFDKPHQYSTGVRYLFVNGVTVIDGGEFTKRLAGRVLRHGAAAPE
jgi:N-acyl-D-aspartate/D-glutamate deacylase